LAYFVIDQRPYQAGDDLGYNLGLGGGVLMLTLLVYPLRKRLSLPFEERFAMLVDREHTWRENRRVARLLREAKLKSSQACLEEVRYGGGRKLDKALMAQLGSCQWIRAHQNLVLTGATGCGKTWLACALGNAACRQGLSVVYLRTPRLFEELRVAHGDGSFGKRLASLAKTDVLILDDWGLAPLNQAERNDLLEVLDDRVGTRSTVITSQLPVEHWHAYLNDPTLADAILDPVLHAAHKLALAGESLRKSEKDKPRLTVRPTRVTHRAAGLLYLATSGRRRRG
jgi:DNA replication protein DnaC